MKLSAKLCSYVVSLVAFLWGALVWASPICSCPKTNTDMRFYGTDEKPRFPRGTGTVCVGTKGQLCTSRGVVIYYCHAGQEYGKWEAPSATAGGYQGLVVGVEYNIVDTNMINYVNPNEITCKLDL